MAFASTANAGITIPAGDWTLDIGGNVNAYYTSTRMSGNGNTAGYGALYMGGKNNGDSAGGDGDSRSQNNITTGLLPNYLSVSGKSRQNDLDVAFTISINPGSSVTQSGGQSALQENRQAFMTIGDASWGSVKLGKDLGIFASDAILNDMTLLGVGGGAGALAGNTTTLGRIGTGYIYADWKSQVAYTSPNWNGFSFTAGVTQALNTREIDVSGNGADAKSVGRGGNQPAFEAKASYAWTGDVAGKVWVSGISQKLDNIMNNAGTQQLDTGVRVSAWDIGANVNVAGLGLTAYYYDGNGIGQTMQMLGGLDATGKRRDSKGGYVQATYVLPTATKIGVSWGESRLDGTSSDKTGYGARELTDRMWTVGAYHPLTKSVNLVAEYSDSKSELDNVAGTVDGKAKGKTVALGAILFF